MILLISAGLLYVWRYIPTHFPSVLKPHVPSYAQWRKAQSPTKEAQSKRQERPVYRWRDKHGQTHISDAPPKGVRAERVHIDPNTNIVPMGRPKHPAQDKQTTDDDIVEIIN